MEITPAREADVPALLELLSRAMESDPFVRWLVRPGSGPAQARARRDYLSIMLERLALPRGLVWVARDDAAIRGAALWAPPRTFELGPGESLRLLPRMARVIGVLRLSAVSEVLETIDAARPPEPRWLLTLVGVDPAHQGQGIGAALLAPALARCDEEGLAAVAETAAEENLRFYERLGFEVTSQRALDDRGTRSWTLVRPPAAGMLPTGGHG